VNIFKKAGLGLVAAGSLTNQELLLLISIVITVLGMIQDYLKGRETE